MLVFSIDWFLELANCTTQGTWGKPVLYLNSNTLGTNFCSVCQSADFMVLLVSLFCLNMCQKCDLRALENGQNSKFKIFSQFSSGSFTAFHRPIYAVYQVDILLILLPISQVILKKLQDVAKKCQENEQNMSGKT